MESVARWIERRGRPAGRRACGDEEETGSPGEAPPEEGEDDGGDGGERGGPGTGRRFAGGSVTRCWSILAVILSRRSSPISSSCPTTPSRPGSAPEVSSLITVPAAHRHDHPGSVLLVYVELTPMRAIEYPFFWLDPNAAIDPSGSILGSETTAQYATEGEIDMSTAQQAATVVALRQLGYKVPVTAARSARLRHPARVAGGCGPPGGRRHQQDQRAVACPPTSTSSRGSNASHRARPSASW